MSFTTTVAFKKKTGFWEASAKRNLDALADRYDMEHYEKLKSPGGAPPRYKDTDANYNLTLEFKDEEAASEFFKSKRVAELLPKGFDFSPETTSVNPRQPTTSPEIIQAYDEIAKIGGSGNEYKSGFSKPQVEGKGIRLSFRDAEAQTAFFEKIAREKKAAFNAYDGSGNAIACSLGDGVLHSKGEPGFEEAFKKAAKPSATAAALKEEIADYRGATEAKNKSGAGDEEKGPPSEPHGP